MKSEMVRAKPFLFGYPASNDEALREAQNQCLPPMDPLRKAVKIKSRGEAFQPVCLRERSSQPARDPVFFANTLLHCPFWKIEQP